VDDPKWGSLLSDIRSCLKAGFYSQEYIDAIMQRHWRRHYDIYDASRSRACIRKFQARELWDQTIP
jgi:hypothetical protein